MPLDLKHPSLLRFLSVACFFIQHYGWAQDTLVKEGPGTMTLYSPNPYAFNANINQGTLALKDAGALPSGCVVWIGAPGILDISGTTPSTTQTIGSLAGATGSSVQLGTIHLNTGGAGTSSTFSGSFTGSGDIIKTGAGLFTLAGNNASATGQVVVSSGAVSVSADINIPLGGVKLQGAALQITGSPPPTTLSRAIQFDSGGTIDVPAACAAYLSGALTGTGPLTKSSDGELRLLSQATYANGTILDAGVLSMGIGNALPLNSQLSINGSSIFQLNQFNQTIGGLDGTYALSTVDLGTAALDFGNGGANSSFNGSIIGSGQLIKSGSGTATLTGASSYTGGTLVNAGTLIGNTNSLQGGIVNNATLVFDQTFNGSFSGGLNSTTSPQGQLQKTGSAALVLAPTAFSQSQFSILNGTVNLIQTAGYYSPFLVAASSVLSGDGVIYGSLDIYGTVSPGNPLGQIFINGPYQYTQRPGSNFIAYFDPNGNSSKFITTGAISIQTLPGQYTTLTLLPLPGSYPDSFNVVLMQAGSAINGQFNQVVNPLPTFDFKLRYTGNQLRCTLGQIPFSEVVTEGNAAAVARCIDSSNPPAGSDFAQVIDLLRFETLPDLIATLNQMQPSMFNAFNIAQQETAVMVNSILQSRIEDLHYKCPPSGRFHLWADGGLFRGSQGSIDGEKGFQFHGEGFSAGVDYSFGRQGWAGLFAAKTWDRIDWKEKAGNGNEQAWYAGLYGGWHIPYFYAHAASSIVAVRDRGSRNIQFNCIEGNCPLRTAWHKNRGLGTALYAEAGSPLDFFVNLRPFVRGDYTYLKRSNFTESGAGSIDLKVNSSQADFLRLEGGLELSKCFLFSRNRLSIYAQAGSVHEWRFKGADASASFIDSSCVMNVKGMNPNRALVAYSLGISFKGAADLFNLSLDFHHLDSKHSRMSYGDLSIAFSF